MRVDLGSVQFGLVDAAGVAWRIGADGLQGWDSPEVRTQLNAREFDHGSWMGPVWFGERPVTLSGTIVAPDAPSLDVAIEQLLAADALGDTTLVVYESIPKQATVRRSGKPIIKRETDSVATFSLLVTAPDPRRYAPTLQQASTALPSVSGGLVLPAAPPWTLSASSVQGAIGALNAGTMASRPVFTIAGPVNQPQVATTYPDGSVKALSYSLNLLTGDRLVIDTDAHTVMLGGASRRRYISGDWPEIPAGTQVAFQFRAATYNASALLTASWRSAWI
jgi:hypothetical protein